MDVPMAKDWRKFTAAAELSRRLDKFETALRRHKQVEELRRQGARLGLKEITGGQIFFEPSKSMSPAAPVRSRGRPSPKALVASEIDRRQKTPQRWSKNTRRSDVARVLWTWLEQRRRDDKTIPRIKNPRAMESLLQRNRLWPPEN
jgi:hypothetical protein